jgi:hypothetical protein
LALKKNIIDRYFGLGKNSNCRHLFREFGYDLQTGFCVKVIIVGRNYSFFFLVEGDLEPFNEFGLKNKASLTVNEFSPEKRLILQKRSVALKQVTKTTLQ